jgi:hypothetical protein
MKKLALLTTGALVASAIVPVLAVDSDVTVNETTIALSGAGDFDFGSGIPTDLVDAQANYTVTTNSANGYEVTLEFTQLDRVDGIRSTSGSGDVIAANLIGVDAGGNSAVNDAAVANGVLADAATYEPADLSAAAKIADSAIRSLEAGDDFTVEVEMTLPWVSDGAYDGAATFTATNL